MPFEHFCHAISRLCDESEDARTSPWLLHSFLKVSVKHLASLDTQQMSIFLHVLNQLTGQLVDIKGLVPTVSADGQEDDDSDDEEDGQDQVWAQTHFSLLRTTFKRNTKFYTFFP